MELQDVILDILDREKITTVLVSHDVDEVVFLCDRVVMMTNGPAATIGEILTIDFPKPRDRASMMADPLYFRCLDHLVSFLTERAHLRTDPRIHDKDSLLTFTGKQAAGAAHGRAHAV
jgi:ABC-type nitrate/sulfonate/bicarbonate transport system ATPase subunit